MAWCITAGMKLWYTNKLPFTSFTTLTPHSSAKRDFHTYVMFSVQYTYVQNHATCIECTVLHANSTCVTCYKGGKGGKGVPCYLN